MKAASLLVGAYRDFWEIYRLRFKESDYEPLVEVSVSGDVAGGREVRLTANPDGLLYIAGQLMKMALTNELGDHLHIDRASVATEESVPLIVLRPYPPTQTKE